MTIPFYMESPRDLLEKARDAELPALRSAVASQKQRAIGYALFNFAATSYHIRDWILHASHTAKAVDKWISDHECLMVCRDLANGNKHREITRYESVVEQTTISARGFASTATLAEIESTFMRPPEFKVKIPLKTGERLELLQWADEVIAAWTRFLDQYGL